MERRRRRGRDFERVYGRAAARAVLEHRMDDVLGIAYAETERSWLGPYLKEAARRRVGYDEVEEGDLERLSDSTHHEGVCLTTKYRRELALDELLARLDDGPAVALDGVDNPHNVGAIVRSAAYLGVPSMILTLPPGAPLLKPSAVRIAEGGAEHVGIIVADDLALALDNLRSRGVAVVGAEASAPHSALGFAWPRRVVVVLGNEGEGLSPAVRAQLDHRVAIPGSGKIDSLNVSVAAGIVLAAAVAGRA